jgi:apolipoprotein N-acyltransferase
VKAVLLAAAGAVVSVLAFPPFGPGWLILVGITAFLTALRLVETRKHGLLVGAVYGFVFFGWLLSWLAQLELIALVLVPVEAVFFVAYGWWLAKYNDRSSGVWLTLAVGGWAFMELIRYHFPTGGFEWGAVGYALSDVAVLADPAPLIGGSGLTVLIVLLSGLGSVVLTRRWNPVLWWAIGLVGLVAFFTVVTSRPVTQSSPSPVATIVQGSTPCPFEHCPPDERLGTYQQHLELTASLEPNPSRWLTVWSEGSTGGVNADPVLNPEVGQAIGDQAQRLKSWMLVGGDRPVSETEWINANVVFDPAGQIVGEYKKQHPVPFGEYIPFRPLFEWIPALDRVPRDMIPGDGPVVFDTDEFKLGSVISFEASFSRYALQHRRAGADVIVVATNEASYGPDAATSDQLIGMSQMRSRELGVPVIHAAVTGKSTIIGSTLTTGLGTQEIFEGGHLIASARTIYSYTGDLVLYLAAVIGVLMWWRTRPLVGSNDRILEEE